MAKLNGTAHNVSNKSEDGQGWGTWEELLLACAVNRYGINSWDSVALEIQKRSSSTPPLLLTPNNCRNKYLHLTRRFLTQNHRRTDTIIINNNNNKNKNDVASDDGSIITTDESVPLLEELRKLRVAELRRELERYDLSIVSLQSKVKKMKEERESNSQNREENRSDLSSKSEEKKRDDNEHKCKGEVKDEPDKSPLSVAGESVSDKDEQSVNESVSTDRRINRDDIGTGGIVEEAKEPDRTEEGSEEPEPTVNEKPVREEDSCYGSSDSVEREEPVRNDAVKVEPESVSQSPELVESVAESKEDDGGGGEEEATAKEECSDVQSSATKSRIDGDNDHMLRGSSEHDDLEDKNKSPAVKIEASVESQPFIDFLDDLKRHKLGSVFLRRLDSQETPDYNNLIRQHIDIETVHTRVQEGAYLDSNLKFFRDLLLLVNNAMVFFSKDTPEFLAASELRHLISNEMAQKSAKSDSSSDKQSSLQKVSLPKKENSEPSESLLLKPNLGGSLIVCRKRSSIAAKATASSSGSDKKKEQAAKLAEEKALLDAKQLPHQPPAKTEDPRITKKRSRDRFASVSTNMKKNGKNGANTNSKQTSATNVEKSQGKGGSSSQQPEPRSESKNKNSSVDLKKRSAANFLNRMKQSSSSNNSTLLDALKSSPLTSGNSSRGGAEYKKNENSKGSGRKEQVYTRVSDGKLGKEKGSPAKKTIGRPPKKGAAPPPPPPPPPQSGKRSRDGRESESVASKNQRKRSRK